MKSVIRDWVVETASHERRFRVSYANTFDEPVGGLMNVLLTDYGQHYQHTELNGGHSLVIDIGGFTTDWIAVNPGGVVDYGLAHSVPLGIQNLVADFETGSGPRKLPASFIPRATPIQPSVSRLRQRLSRFASAPRSSYNGQGAPKGHHYTLGLGHKEKPLEV